MIKWIQAIIDLPAASFEVGQRYWAAVVASTLGEPNPDHDEFVALVPPSGDLYLALQRLESGNAAVHLDLLVDNVAAVTAQAVAAGAALIADNDDYAVLATPGGVPFCVLPHKGEATSAPVIDPALPHAVDQICLDVPSEHFDADVAFWSDLTGWETHEPTFDEFRSFRQPSHLPFRLLIQRLGPNDDGPGRAHLDISCGEHVGPIAEQHLAAGATLIGEFKYWTALRSPAGIPYCLTRREPSRS